MNRNVQNAIEKIAAKIRAGEIADMEESIIGEDVELYVRLAFEAKYRGDKATTKAILRKAGRSGFAIQLSIPGMDHASLVPCTYDDDDNPVPFGKSKFGKIRHEVARNVRAAAVVTRIADGQQQTCDRLQELGVTDDWTGDEILEQFGPEMNDGTLPPGLTS